MRNKLNLMSFLCQIIKKFALILLHLQKDLNCKFAIFKLKDWFDSNFPFILINK